MTDQHQLDKIVDEENKEKALSIAKTVLIQIKASIDKRCSYIRARQLQIQKLEELKARVYPAFDKLDISELKSIAARMEFIEVNNARNTRYTSKATNPQNSPRSVDIETSDFSTDAEV